MSDTLTSSNELGDSIIESFRKGSERGTSTFDVFHAYGFAYNPFDLESLLKHPELLDDNRKQLLNNLAERVGACYSSSTNLLLVGPPRAGKTAILRLLHEMLNKRLGSDFCDYVYAPVEWQGLSSKEDEEGERIDNLQNWLSTKNFDKTKIVLVDDADSCMLDAEQYVNSMKLEQMQVPIIVFCITPTTHSVISKHGIAEGLFGDVFWMSPLPRSHIKRIIVSSIERAAPHTNPFDDSSIDRIVHYSLGLPGLAMRLAIASLKTAYQTGERTISKPIVDRAADNESLSVAVSLAEGQLKLDGTRYYVAAEILTQYYLRHGNVERSRIITTFMDRDIAKPPTLAYHLKALIDGGIIRQKRIGYKVFYSMPEPIRGALQLVYMHGIPEAEAGDVP